MTATFMSGFLALNLPNEVAYATISVNMVEITQLAQAILRVFKNHIGNWFTESD